MEHADSVMARGVAEEVFPGGVLLVAKESRQLFCKAYGYADLFSKTPSCATHSAVPPTPISRVSASLIKLPSYPAMAFSSSPGPVAFLPNISVAPGALPVGVCLTK